MRTIFAEAGYKIEEINWKNPQNILEEYPIILSTTFSSRSCLKDATYDYLIMDEASQVDLATGALVLASSYNAVIGRIIQQAIAQQLVPIYEPLFSEDSYGYHRKRSAQQAITRVKEYAEEGYTQAVLADLSKYFDTTVS